MFVEYDPSVPGAREKAIQRLIACFNELRMWMARWMLKLNDDNTEMVIFMSKYHLQKYGLSTMAVGNSTIMPVACVRDLGVQLDQHLNMDQHVTAVCKACHYQLRRLCCIRRYLTTDATKNTVQALITSRLDYCDSLLAGIPSHQLERLKRIQNKAPRLITETRQRDHITPVLKELHWLSVSSRIKYKVLVLAYKCVHGQAPSYLSRLLKTQCHDERTRGAKEIRLYQPTSKKAIGTCAFQVAAPELWNKQPAKVRMSTSLASYKTQLKTHMIYSSITTNANSFQ